MSDFPEPRLFSLVRGGDESGVSGTGRVLDGTIYHNGKVTVCWRTDTRPDQIGLTSVAVYDSFDAFMAIHVDSHPTNESRIVFHDD